MVGIGKGAERGILIKDAESLETAKKIDTVVLDKTGTVTEGKPVVGDLIWATQTAAHENIFYSLEKLSEHPLAEAVVRHLQNARDVSIDNFESITGKGVKGESDGKTYYAGNRKLLEENRITVSRSLSDEAARLAADAQTVIWFADSENALAIAGITDQIKQSSIQAVSELQAAGIEVYMLTGDNEALPGRLHAKPASSIIGRGCCRRIRPPLSAACRKTAGKWQWQATASTTVQPGASDLSIAMGGGSDIAMDVAKMTIISSDLTKIPEALKLSRLTVRTIRQNLFWAFIYNIIGVPVAAAYSTPSTASC